MALKWHLIGSLFDLLLLCEVTDLVVAAVAVLVAAHWMWTPAVHVSDEWRRTKLAAVDVQPARVAIHHPLTSWHFVAVVSGQAVAVEAEFLGATPAGTRHPATTTDDAVVANPAWNWMVSAMCRRRRHIPAIAFAHRGAFECVVHLLGCR